jgi:1-acyl-sn-glycerol-3-phosphate acyltransferase
MLLLGYRIRYAGGEQLPTTPYLLVCNHRSAFDPLCVLAVSAQPTVFVAKPSVLRIPVIGTLMTRLGFMAIDRENARNAVTTIKQAAARIRDEGLCVGIYPEGTRCKTATMLPFHAGSFKIATLAACPVVVASIRYTKRGLWGKQVHLQVVDVMDVDYVAANSTAALSQRAREAIEGNLNA